MRNLTVALLLVALLGGCSAFRGTRSCDDKGCTTTGTPQPGHLPTTDRS